MDTYNIHLLKDERTSERKSKQNMEDTDDKDTDIE